jgi:hypothetical protein
MPTTPWRTWGTTLSIRSADFRSSSTKAWRKSLEVRRPPRCGIASSGVRGQSSRIHPLGNRVER